MPHVSRREILEKLERRSSTERLVSLELIIEEPDGTELIRAGGIWDDSVQQYVAATAGFAHEPERIRLQRSQVPLMRGLARWVRLVREAEAAQRLDPRAIVAARPAIVIAGGNPGSGKTFALMIFAALVAIEWPDDVQFVSNLNLDNRGECFQALSVIGRSHWYTDHRDPKDPRLDWINGATLKWCSARNTKKLRQRGLRIRHVMLNEAQLQSEEMGVLAQLAPRNLGGLLTLAMNPPTTEGGNWTARSWYGIESGEVLGECYQMHSADNDAVDHAFIDAAGASARIMSPRLAGAEVDGIITTAGPSAYPSFDGRPYNAAEPKSGGCVGVLPELGYEDVTRELTAPLMGARSSGADAVIGSDFQKHPGCCGVAARIFRHRATRRLVLQLDRAIGVPGQEDAYSQALIDAGYTGNGFRSDGTRGPMALLVGDATAARQSAGHDAGQPPSFWAMENNGWPIIAPATHHRTGRPWWAPVLESLDQMFVLFEQRVVLLGPACREVLPEFGPSAVDCFRNAQKNYLGKLRRGEVFQHLPDCVRYLAWLFLPRPMPTALPPTSPEILAELRSIKLRD